MKKERHLGMTIEQNLHYKLRFIAEYYGRSGNAQVLYSIRMSIEEFEREHGEIVVPEDLGEK